MAIVNVHVAWALIKLFTCDYVFKCNLSSLQRDDQYHKTLLTCDQHVLFPIYIAIMRTYMHAVLNLLLMYIQVLVLRII